MFSMDFLVKEFLFDCGVRSLSEQTILNYKKQLGHFVRFLETNCQVTNIEDLKPLHIKLFILSTTVALPLIRKLPRRFIFPVNSSAFFWVMNLEA